MTPDRRLAFRDYLLGRAGEGDSTAVEDDYFADERVLEAVAEEEDALIDDYLAQRLSVEDRDQFERVYLASPHHRRRVAVTRALMSALSSTVPRRTVLANRRVWYAALGSAAAVLVAAMFWMTPATRDARTVARDIPLPAPPPQTDVAPPLPPAAPPPQAPAAPRVLAMLLSPVAVRAGNDAPVLTISEGTDIVALDLQGPTTVDHRAALRGVVRTVSGDTIWQGAASPVADPLRAVIARIEMPARLLPPDDYSVTLVATGGGTNREIERYFLRVRAR